MEHRAIGQHRLAHFPFSDAKDFCHIVTDLILSLRQNGQRLHQALGNLASEFSGFQPETGAKHLILFEAGVPQKLKLVTHREKRIHFHVDALVAHLKLTLVRHALPSKDMHALNHIRTLSFLFQ